MNHHSIPELYNASYNHEKDFGQLKLATSKNKSLFLYVKDFDGTLKDVRPSRVGPLRFIEMTSGIYEKDEVATERVRVHLGLSMEINKEFPSLLYNFGLGVMASPTGSLVSLEVFYNLIRDSGVESDRRLLEIRIRDFYEGLRSTGDETYYPMTFMTADVLEEERLALLVSNPELPPLEFDKVGGELFKTQRQNHQEFLEWYKNLTVKYAPQ